jgi:hypothetical protein
MLLTVIGFGLNKNLSKISTLREGSLPFLLRQYCRSFARTNARPTMFQNSVNIFHFCRVSHQTINPQETPVQDEELNRYVDERNRILVSKWNLSAALSVLKQVHRDNSQKTAPSTGNHLATLPIWRLSKVTGQKDAKKDKIRFVNYSGNVGGQSRYHHRTVVSCTADNGWTSIQRGSNPFEPLTLLEDDTDNALPDTTDAAEDANVTDVVEDDGLDEFDQAQSIASDDDVDNDETSSTTTRRASTPPRPAIATQSTDDDDDDDHGEGPSTGPRKRQRRGVISSFGRDSLSVTSYSAKKVPQKRKIKETTKLMNSQKGKHGTRTLFAGTIQANLRVGSGAPLSDFQTIVKTMLENYATIVNIVHVHAQKAALFIIENIIEEGEQHYWILQEMVDNGTKNDGGNAFWQNLCNLVCKGRTQTKFPLLKKFMRMEGWEQFVIQKELLCGYSALSVLLENNASVLASSFRGQVIGRLPSLIAKVLETYGEDEEREVDRILGLRFERPIEQEIENYLNTDFDDTESLPGSSIFDDNLSDSDSSDEDYQDAIFDLEETPRAFNNSTKHKFDAVVKFHLINSMLPRPERFAVVPSSGIVHKSILVTEASLLYNIKANVSIFGEKKSEWVSSNGKLVKCPGVLWQNLFPRIVERKKLILIDQADPAGNSSRILISSIKTDGLDLSLLYVDQKTKPEKSFASKRPVMELARTVGRTKRLKSDDIYDEDRERIRKVVGGDPGEVYFVGLCATNVDDYYIDDNFQPYFKKKSKLNNLKLKTSAASEPSRRFRNFLEHEKRIASSDGDRSFSVSKTTLNVFELERLMERILITVGNRHIPLPATESDELEPPRLSVRMSSAGN